MYSLVKHLLISTFLLSLCISWLLSFSSLQLTSCNAHSMIGLHYIHNPILWTVPLPYYFKENLTRGFPYGQDLELLLPWPTFNSWLGDWDPASNLVWQKKKKKERKKTLPCPEDTASSLITKYSCGNTFINHHNPSQLGARVEMSLILTSTSLSFLLYPVFKEKYIFSNLSILDYQLPILYIIDNCGMDDTSNPDNIILACDVH